jgi:(2Fe-2S) ferredoxin
MAFSIDNGTTWQEGDGFFTDLSAGTYSVMVESANGCMVYHEDNPIVFEEPDELIMSGLEVSDVTCNGASNGMIDVEAAGGTGTIYYSANGGATWQEEDLLYGLPAGSYEVMVMDDNGCITPYSQNPVVIDEPEALVYDQVNTTNVNCNGGASGTIDISASGGTGQIDYSIGNNEWQTNGLFEELEAGEYELRIRDDRNCLNIFDDNPVVIIQPEAMVWTETELVPVECFGSTDGIIVLEAQGGSGIIEYSIDGGESWQSDNVFDELTAGTYNLMARDANGCILDYQENPVIFEEPEELLITEMQSQDVSCFGYEDGIINISAQGGTGTLAYSADNGSTFQDEALFEGLAPGSYHIVVADDNGCQTAYGENPAIIHEPELLEVSVLADADTAEIDETVVLTASSNYAVDYYWTHSGETAEEITVTESQAGEYVYEVEATNSQQCTATASDTVVFTLPTAIETDEMQEEEEIMLMPNPTDGLFDVVIENTKAVWQMRLYNPDGRMIIQRHDVKSRKGKVTEGFDLSGYASGMYYLHLYDGNQTFVKKIVVN